MTNFEINPYQSIIKNLDSSSSLDNVNNACYSISKAYGNVYGKKLENQLNYKCDEIVYNKKKELNPSLYYVRQPAKSIEWNQSSHYFPELFKQSNDPKQSYQSCYLKCGSDRYPNECRLNCKYDSDAVVMVEDFHNEQPYNKTDEKYFNKPINDKDDNDDNDDNNSRLFTTMCYIGFIAFFLFTLYKSLYAYLKKQNNKDTITENYGDNNLQLFKSPIYFGIIIFFILLFLNMFIKFLNKK